MPEELQKIIARALKKKREARYGSAEELCEDLKAYEAALQVDALGVFNLRSLVKTLRRPAVALHPGNNTHQYTEFMIQVVKDFKRCIDYLETRRDIDSGRMAYYGMSWGGILGAIIPAVEERLKAS